MSYQQNRDSYRGNTQRNSNNSNDGQIGAKRRKPNRWPNKQRVKENEMALKRDRRSEFESYGIDTPLFKTPLLPQRSPNPRNRAQNSNYADDRYNYNDQQYNNDRYDNSSYNHQRTLASPGRNMRDAHSSSPAQQKKSQHEMRTKQQFVEPQHSGPAWYWEKYFDEIHNWQDKHKLSYYKSRCMALEFENQMLFEQVKSLIEENSVFAAERGEIPTMLLPNFPGGQEGFECDNTAAEKPSADRTPKNKDNEQKEKKVNADKEKGEDQEKKEREVKNEGPKEPRGFKRKEELEQLYGESAELILNLETSIQHNFNRNCDTHNPQMWMDEPLNAEIVVA